MSSAKRQQEEDDANMQECSGCEDAEALEACLLRYFPAEDLVWRIAEFGECCGCGQMILSHESHYYTRGSHPECPYCYSCFFSEEDPEWDLSGNVS